MESLSYVASILPCSAVCQAEGINNEEVTCAQQAGVSWGQKRHHRVLTPVPGLTTYVTLNSDAILPGDPWVSTSSIRRTPSGKMRSTDEF